MRPSDLTLAMTLTFNFQGQIWNLLYLNQKWSDCHETKNEHISWTLGLKCDHQIWPWPWIFKVKYEICYISTKSGPIATRQKANISIWTLGLKFDNGFDLGHDLDIWIFKVICDLDHLVTKVGCKDLPDSDRGDFSCRRAVDSSSYHYFSVDHACLWCCKESEGAECKPFTSDTESNLHLPNGLSCAQGYCNEVSPSVYCAT